jgi:hypothetical protein
MCGADLFNALSGLFWLWVILLGAVPLGICWSRDDGSGRLRPPQCQEHHGPISERIVAALGWLPVRPGLYSCAAGTPNRLPRAARLRPRTFAVLRLMTCSNP